MRMPGPVVPTDQWIYVTSTSTSHGTTVCLLWCLFSEPSLPLSNPRPLKTGCEPIVVLQTQMYQKGTLRFILYLTDRIPFFVYNPREGSFYIHSMLGPSFTVLGIQGNTTLYDLALLCQNCVIRSKRRSHTKSFP